jgi:hypothetical protein
MNGERFDMRTRTFTLATVTLVLAAGCSGSASNAGSPPSTDKDSGPGQTEDASSGSDAGGVADSAPDAGKTGNTGPCLAQQTEPVSAPNGVLTNRPTITFTNTATNGLKVVNAYFVYQVGYINWWGEAINNGTQPSCIPLGTVTMDGATVTTTVHAPPYMSGLTSTSACVAPGAKGQFWGIAQGNFANISNVDYSFTGLSEAATPATDVQVQNATVSGETVTGQVSVAAAVYNFGVDVFVRDCRGVLVDKVPAFPGNLMDLSPGQSLAFTTNPAARPFDDFVTLPSWIEGKQMTRRPPNPLDERLAVRAQQETQMRAMRAAQEVALGAHPATEPSTTP